MQRGYGVPPFYSSVSTLRNQHNLKDRDVLSNLDQANSESATHESQLEHGVPLNVIHIEVF